MSTLLARYLANPSTDNASLIAAYQARHPLAMAMLDMIEVAILADALAVLSTVSRH